MKTAARIHKQGKQHITDLAHVTHDLWVKMYEDVGIPADTKFVDDEVLKPSKYYRFYNKAQQQYWEAIEQYQAGGYVGLSLSRRQH